MIINQPVRISDDHGAHKVKKIIIIVIVIIIVVIVIVIATIIINHLFSEISPMAVVRAGKTRLEVTVAHVAHISWRFRWSINQQVSWMYNMMLKSTTYKIRHVLPMLVTLGMLEEVVPLE